MKNLIKIVTINLFLVSCATQESQHQVQKSDSNSCNKSSEETKEIHVIHKSFLEQVNPVNAFAPIFDGIFTDIQNMKNELNKDENSTRQSGSCSSQN